MHKSYEICIFADDLIWKLDKETQISADLRRLF